MRISSLDVYRYSLELKRPLILHGQTLNKREGLILQVKSEDGYEGFGEVAPLPGFSKETLNECQNQISYLKPNLCALELPSSFQEIHFDKRKWLADSDLYPSVQFGIESAIAGLLANTNNVSLNAMLSKQPNQRINVSGLISGSMDDLKAQTQNLLGQGFTELKLKIGGSPDDAVKKVNVVNNVAYGKALLHVDVNRAWDFDTAVAFGKEISCAAISYIEEPFKDVQRIPEFFDKTMIPVALDESIQNMVFDDIRSISGVDILILKPTILGGIGKVKTLIDQIDHFGLNAVISSSFESSVGLSVLASLAGIASHNIAASGLDTLKWFKEDTLNEPIKIQNGAIEVQGKAIAQNDMNFKCLYELK